MTVWILNASFDFYFWSWKKFLLFICPNDNHVVKSSDYLFENYVMNYSDFPPTLWADFSSSTMQITTAASPSIPNLTWCFILHIQTYISKCTGINTCGVRHMKCGDKHMTRGQNMQDRDAYIYITHFLCNYIIFTKNQNQIVTQYSFLFVVRSATCFGQILAIFRESYVVMFQLRIISCDYNCCSVYSY